MYIQDESPLEVAGVCSCSHESSYSDSLWLFRRVSRWFQMQNIYRVKWPLAVAGVCSCNHESSIWDSLWVLWWSQEQTPATASLENVVS
jgi:hypothetical protein